MVLLANEKAIDLSFIPSLECNIECPFCMYNASPSNTDKLDFEKTKTFIETINWDLINSIGFYGGEPSINIPLYQKFINLIPSHISKFTISNGTWSNSLDDTTNFFEFLIINNLYLVISGTPYHKEHQNLMTLKLLKDEFPDYIRLKGDDQIHPMGRAEQPNWACTNKCHPLNIPIRLGLFPNGNILFQNCDGVYPVVQTYLDPFNDIIEKVNIVKKECSVKNYKGNLNV